MKSINQLTLSAGTPAAKATKAPTKTTINFPEYIFYLFVCLLNCLQFKTN